ncbi:MAG: ABC transporter permease [Clostridiales Family XIII bacterium]|jgi:peptide/nickel transport system permease protein|nr:ABC transporter permease [Clostridiales Family XIII bacterium]
MINYIIQRVVHAVIIIVLVSLAVFLLIRMLPGDPIEIIVSQNTLASYGPEYYDQLAHEYGLDRPVMIQFVDWFGNIIRGEFGNSILHNFNIGEQIKDRLTVTLLLGLTAFVISFIVGPLLGIISAIRRGTWIDNLVTVVANIGITAPTFWIGILLIYFVGLKAGLLPLYGYTLPWTDLGLSIRQSIMPIIVIALSPIASSARQMRSSVLEVLNEDYVRTAWAKGLKEKAVIYKHVMKNSLMPVITLQGTMLRQIIGGQVVVETVFVIPGLGKMMVDAFLSNDYPVVQAVTLVMTIVVVISSLVVDFLYGWIDPRIQYE